MQREIGISTLLNTHIVIRVENPGDVLSQVSVQHCLNVSPDVNCGTAAAFRLSPFLAVLFFNKDNVQNDDVTVMMTIFTVFEVKVTGGLG